jgi:3-phenylpropionate/trans-cinnamate dioxygenase ferredoxin reductase subunit
MPFRRGSDLAHDVWIEERKCRVSVKRGQTLLQAALEAGIDFPHLCRVGSCGTCKCRLLSGRVKMLTDASYVLSAQDLRDGYILACQALVRSEARVSLGSNAQAEES